MIWKTFLTFLVAAVLLVNSSSAALVTETLSGTVTFGPALGETATGSFTYEDGSLTGIGEEILAFPDLTLTFDFVGQTFTEIDDTDFDEFPELTLTDGVPTSLDFFVLDGDGVGQEIIDPRFTEFGIFDLVPDVGGGFIADITTFLIPEPATAALAMFAIFIGTAIRRR